MWTKKLSVLWFAVAVSGTWVHAADIGPQPFTIGRIKYAGGGDWYADPSSLPNLLARVRQDLGISTAQHEDIVELTSSDLFRHPYLYLTGHGEIRLTDEEASALREHLLAGGFLHADDNYGLDGSFRREMAKVFPERELVPVTRDHVLYSLRHRFPLGLPKIHEHDGEPAQSFAYFDGERIMVLYTYSADLGDGWEDARVHNDPDEIREAALQMGVNIVAYSLTH
jgi:hypothetical protein